MGGLKKKVNFVIWGGVNNLKSCVVFLKKRNLPPKIIAVRRESMYVLLQPGRRTSHQRDAIRNKTMELDARELQSESRILIIS